MTINLITGIGGFVASHLADYLLEKNEKIIGTYRWYEDLSRINHIKDKITMVPADLTDLSSLIRAIADHKPDYIYHLAAQSFVNDSFTNPIMTIHTNTVGTVNLLEAIRLTKDYIDKKYDPMIHICSSSEFYGKVDKAEIPITENHPMRPGNQYAVGKVGADAAGYFYSKYYGLKIIRTRMFTHCGLRRSMLSAENSFAKQIAEFEKHHKETDGQSDKEYVLKHGNLDSIRTWADVRDAVRAYWVMMRKCKPGEVYNIAGDTQKTIGEMLDYLISLSPLKEKIIKEQDPNLMRKLDVNLQVVDCSKFKKETGWKPKISFENLMEDLLNYWRKNV